MRARLGNVILWTACFLVFLIIYVLVSDHVQPGMVPYWWMASAAIGLIGLLAHYMLTGDR
jgi:hypothetical protein